MRTAWACFTLTMLAVSMRSAVGQTPLESASPVAPAPAESTADRRLTQLELRAFHVLGSGLGFRRISATDVLGQRAEAAENQPNTVRAEEAIPTAAAEAQPVGGDDSRSAADFTWRAEEESVEAPPIDESDVGTALQWQGEEEVRSDVNSESASETDELPPSPPASVLPTGSNPLRRLHALDADGSSGVNPLRRWFRQPAE